MNLAPPFLVYAMPRSRSFWLAQFLSYGEWHCGHEELRHLRSLADVKAWFSQLYTGTVETAAAPFWRLQQQLVPQARVVVLRRNLEDIVDSFIRTGVKFNEEALEAQMLRLSRKQDQILARVPGALEVWFEDLHEEATAKQVFEFCLPYAFDKAWWKKLRDLELQCDIKALYRYLLAYKKPLDVVQGQAKQAMLAHLRPQAQGDFTFQQEPFDQFYTDAQPLFREHLSIVGEVPENFVTKNVPLMRQLEESGNLLVTTARCNGKLFGYAMSLLGPALDKQGELVGTNTTFFVSSDAVGIGLKLQRASVEALRARGARMVHFQTGTRGGAERLRSIFRRLGAEPSGEFFTLRLGEV